MFPARFIFDLYLPTKHTRHLNKEIVSSLVCDLYGDFLDAKTKAMVDELYRCVSLNEKGIKRSDFELFNKCNNGFLTPIHTLQSKLCTKCFSSECLKNICSVRKSLFSGKYMSLDIMIPLLLKDPFEDNYLQICKTSRAVKTFGSFGSQNSNSGLKHASSGFSDTSTIDILLPEARKFNMMFPPPRPCTSQLSQCNVAVGHGQYEGEDCGDYFSVTSSSTVCVLQADSPSCSPTSTFFSLNEDD